MENIKEAPQKIKTELPYDPAILLLGIYPKKTKSLTQKDICTPIFVTALFTVTETWKWPKCPWVGEEIKQLWCTHTHTHTHTHTRTSFRHKKEQILPFPTTWMNLKGIMLSETSQMQKHKYYMISLIRRILRKNKNPSNSKKMTSDLWLPELGGVGRGNWMKVVKGIDFWLWGK